MALTRSLSYPLRLDGAGRAISTTDPSAMWRDRVAVLLATLVGERAGDLFYGTDMSNASFGALDAVRDTVEEAVQAAFVAYLPDLSLDSVEVNTDSSSESRVIVTVLFTTPGSSAPQSATSSLDVNSIETL